MLMRDTVALWPTEHKPLINYHGRYHACCRKARATAPCYRSKICALIRGSYKCNVHFDQGAGPHFDQGAGLHELRGRYVVQAALMPSKIFSTCRSGFPATAPHAIRLPAARCANVTWCDLERKRSAISTVFLRGAPCDCLGDAQWQGPRHEALLRECIVSNAILLCRFR